MEGHEKLPKIGDTENGNNLESDSDAMECPTPTEVIENNAGVPSSIEEWNIKKMRLRKNTDYEKDTGKEDCEEDLVVKFIDSYKGSGVFAVKDIGKGKLLTVYKGELISEEEGNRRHGSYTTGDGSFLFFFKYKKKSFCIDATHSSGIGRMINDNHRKPNGKVVVEDKDGHPTLCIYSIRQILRGEEVCFDYQDPSVPWRKRNAPRYPLYLCPDNSHCIGCIEGADNKADGVESQADNKADGVEKQADNKADGVEKQADNKADGLEKQADNKADSVEKQVDNKAIGVEKQADNKADGVEKQADNKADSVEKQADNKADCVEKQADNKADGVEKQTDNKADGVEKQADNKADGVEKQADNKADGVEKQAVNKGDGVEKQADNKANGVKKQLDNKAKGVEKQADNKADGLEKQADNKADGVEKQTDNKADGVEKQADNKADGVEKQADNKADGVEKQAVNKADGVEKQADNKANGVKKQVDNKANGVEKQADNKADGVKKQTDNKADGVEKQADNKADDVEKQTDNKADGVEKQADYKADGVEVHVDSYSDCVGERAEYDTGCVEDHIKNEAGCVIKLVDIDCIEERNDSETDFIEKQADNDLECDEESLDGASSSAELFGVMVVMKEKEEFDVFAMCSSVLSLGSARSSDIIVKNAALHEVILQANRFREVFLFHKETQFSEGRVLKHDEVFPVGGRLFKWKYPLTHDNSHSMSCTESAENDPDCVVEHADSDPDCAMELADSDPDCVNEHDNDPDCAVEQAVSDPDLADCESGEEIFYTESIDDDIVKDPNFNFEDSDEQYISEEDYVSGSDDNSDIIPFVQSLPMLQNKRKLDNCLGTKTKKIKKSVQCEIVTSTGMPGRQKVHTDILSDQSNNVKLQPSRNQDGKRVWDKLHYCVYCEESFTNLTKHLFGYHKHEKEVVRISNMPKKSKDRADALLKVRNSGDYKHNMNVLKNGNGTLITWSRKVGEEHSPTDYLPCEDCLAFFLKDSLWRHRKNCPFRKEKSVNRKIQSAASLLLPVSERISAGLKENVVKKMLVDEVSMAVRNDSLILSVGEKLFQKHGHLEHLNTYISQKMRELGRLLISARRIDLEIQNLSDILVPAKFSKVAVAATRALCKYDDNKNTYGNPSLAMKIGHLLKKCVRIKKSASLIAGDSEGGNQADDFLDLIENEWTDEVSSCALQTLNANKINKSQILPLTEDIMKLQAYLQNLSNTSVATLQKEFSKSAYDLLNQVSLARLVLFNRRRGGETQRVLLEAYVSKRKRASTSTPKEVEESFSPVEKMLCSMFSRIEIRGKKGRTVPVLLTQELESSIDLLLQHRESAGVNEDNPYLFPRSNFESKQPIRSTDVLRKFARQAHLSRPEDITSTKLRKHVATISQVLNLSKHDMETMAEFMGHDIDVHRAFYRLPQETIQVVKMGRLLKAFDNGTIAQYKGKTLDEIDVDKDMELSSEDDADFEMDCDDDDEEDEFLTENVVRTHDIQQCSIQACSRMNVSEDSDDDEGSKVDRTGKRTKPLREKSKREVQRLTEDQNKLLKTLFKTNVQLRRELRRVDCENVLNKYSVLRNLNWKKVKNTVHNWITQEKRKMKQI